MDYKLFEILATGYMKQERYHRELYDQVVKVAKKHKVQTDFIGLPDEDDLALNAIADAIRTFDTNETFEYFYYDCKADYDKFNQAISWESNGKTYRPDCYDLETLWEYIMYENNKRALRSAPVTEVC